MDILPNLEIPMSTWHIGTIGFSYKEWVGEFYPSGSAQHDYFPYYCKIFNSVELDTTFHSIPRIATVESWGLSTPPEFKICLKTPRTITHELGLQDSLGIMSEFLDSLYPLQEKTGPILIQLPPRYKQDRIGVLGNFLDTLPSNHRYAVEFRHPSWYNQKTADLLSAHNVGWVAIEYPGLPRQINLTSDFLYIRWIGVNGMYQHHSYERVDKTPQLRWWLQALAPLQERVSHIYGYFNNDYAGFAAGTCKRFLILAGLNDDQPTTPFQERLF